MANSGIKVEVGDLVVNEHDAATAAVGLYIGGTKVVGAQQATVADAAAAALSTSDIYTDAAVNTALDLLVAKINAILVVLETHGLVASS